MRIFDLYRIINLPDQRFNAFHHPKFQKALQKLDAVEERMKQAGLENPLLEEWEDAKTELACVELELMFCFAFAEGMEFQRSLNTNVNEIDISIN